MDLVELAACMRPASDFINGAIAVQMMEPCIGVGLKGALEVLQMLPRMFAFAIFRIREPDRGRGLLTRGPIVTHIGPEPAGLGLAIAGRKHRHRCIVGVELRSCQHMLLIASTKGASNSLAPPTHPASVERSSSTPWRA